MFNTEVSSDQSSEVNIKGDNNYVEINQKQEADYEIDYESEFREVSAFHQEEGDLKIKVKLKGCNGDVDVFVSETGDSKQAECGSTLTFEHQDIVVDQTFKVCGNADGSTHTVCEEGVNGPEREPEEITLNL